MKWLKVLADFPQLSEKTASVIWQNEVHGFKYWFGANDDETIARLMHDLADKGIQKFVQDLTTELQITHS